MSQVSPWFERQFTFTIGVEQYPNLLIRLRGTPARLEELVRNVPRSVLVPRDGDKWSPQEHAGHLLDLESLWMARVTDYVSDRDILTVADLTNSKTHQANHNAHNLSDILAEFRNARLTFVDSVEGLTPSFLTRTIAHPRLRQPMRLLHHLYFAAEHDDHHLARIWEMINGRG